MAALFVRVSRALCEHTVPCREAAASFRSSVLSQQRPFAAAAFRSSVLSQQRPFAAACSLASRLVLLIVFAGTLFSRSSRRLFMASQRCLSALPRYSPRVRVRVVAGTVPVPGSCDEGDGGVQLAATDLEGREGVWLGSLTRCCA